MNRNQRDYLETPCASCGRPIVLRLGIDADADHAAALVPLVICERCRLARTSPAPLVRLPELATRSCSRGVYVDEA